MDRGYKLSRRSLVAWEILSLLKSAGLNILDVYKGNQAALDKLLWNMCMKKDTLWIRWIHSYYVKGHGVGDST